MSVSQYLKNSGYTLRERANLYEGVAVGILYPTAFIRYAAVQNLGGDYGSLEGELIGWGVATLFNLPFVLNEFCGGIAMGSVCARQIKRPKKDSDKK